MDKEINGHLYIANDNLKRIADALEEILRLVKKDLDAAEAYRKNKMTRRISNPVIYINHWRWLESQGPSYKQQATSCKLQAASLTRRLNSVIGVYRRKNYENK